MTSRSYCVEEHFDRAQSRARSGIYLNQRLGRDRQSGGVAQPWARNGSAVSSRCGRGGPGRSPRRSRHGSLRPAAILSASVLGCGSLATVMSSRASAGLTVVRIDARALRTATSAMKINGLCLRECSAPVHVPPPRSYQKPAFGSLARPKPLDIWRVVAGTLGRCPLRPCRYSRNLFSPAAGGEPNAEGRWRGKLGNRHRGRGGLCGVLEVVGEAEDCAELVPLLGVEVGVAVASVDRGVADADVRKAIGIVVADGNIGGQVDHGVVDA